MDGLLGKIADNALDSIHESKSAKRELKNDLKRESKQSEQELKMQKKQAEQERKEQRKLEVSEQLSEIESAIHEINFDITNPDSITSGLSTLSNLLVNLDSIDAYGVQSGLDTSFSERKRKLEEAAEKKKASGMSMLEAVDPNNPVLLYFKQQQKTETEQKAKQEEKNKKETKKAFKWMFIIMIALFGLAALAQTCS